MANTQAWQDRDFIMGMFANTRNEMRAIIQFSDALQTIKTEIMADNARKTQLTQLLLEDPTMRVADVLAKIAQIKTMADYCAANPL